MSRPGVMVIAIAAASLAIGVLVRRSWYSAGGAPDVHEEKVVTTTGGRDSTEPGGWIARPGANTNAARSRADRRPPGFAGEAGSEAGVGSGRDSRSAAGTGQIGGRERAAGLGNRALRGDRGGTGDVGSGSDAIHVESGAPSVGLEGAGAQLPKRVGGARSGSDNPGESVATDKLDEPAQAPSRDGVLLSIPFRDGANPEVGGAGMLAEGLASKTDGGIEFSEKSRVSLPAEGNIESESGTISLEVTAAWGGGNSSNQALVTIGEGATTENGVADNALQLAKNATGLVLMAHDAEGQPQYVRFPLDDWSESDPHRVAATWDAKTQSVALYVDGDLIGTAPYGGFTINDKTQLHIGSDKGGGWPALQGTLSSVQVLNKVLGPDEIADVSHVDH